MCVCVKCTHSLIDWCFVLLTAGYLLASKRTVVEGSFGEDGKGERH